MVEKHRKERKGTGEEGKVRKDKKKSEWKEDKRKAGRKEGKKGDRYLHDRQVRVF
jgi:hypothetical protein